MIHSFIPAPWKILIIIVMILLHGHQTPPCPLISVFSIEKYHLFGNSLRGLPGERSSAAHSAGPSQSVGANNQDEAPHNRGQKGEG